MEAVDRDDPRGTHWVCPDCGYAVKAAEAGRGPLFCDDHQLVDRRSPRAAEMELMILTDEEARFVEVTGGSS